MQITQTRTSAPTTETKVYPVPSFWKEAERPFSSYNTFYAIVEEKKVIMVTTFNDNTTASIRLQDRLHGCDSPDVEITSEAFSIAYEAAQLAITDAFQTAFPSPVHLEMAHEFNEND